MIGAEDPKVRQLANYQVTEHGYLVVAGQSCFPIYGKTGDTTGVMMRYKHLGGGSFREEIWATVDCMGLK